MAQTLKINNFSDLNVVEKGILDADVAVGATSLTVQNNENIANLDHLYVGKFGAETSEKRTVSGVTAATGITVDALTEKHFRFDPFTKLFGNQIKIYRAANVDGTQPADGSFTLLATVAIDFDQRETLYTDSGGSSSYWYKFIYYNSTSAAATNLADSKAVRGGGIGNYASIEAIRKKSGFQNNRNITDGDVDAERQAAQREIDSMLGDLYTVPFTSPINPIITRITVLLAAGALLTTNYGVFSGQTINNGKAMIDEAMGLLDKINERKLILQNATGVTTESTAASGFDAWPDATTIDADADVGGGDRMFRVSDRY